MDANHEGEQALRRPKRDVLSMYYKVEEGASVEGPGAVVGGTGTAKMASTSDGTGQSNPLDINGASFSPEAYLAKLLKERNLTELMDKESEMTKSIRSLDSDMQTLVYENYNKFISATGTIKKMKNDFKKMEDEMDCLATNMNRIMEFSGKISSTLQDRRQKISKLSGVHVLLKKLQFLFELPARLTKCIELEAFSQAVRYHSKAKNVLHQYQHIPSFHGIQEECNVIVAQLIVKLKEKFRNKESTPQELAECVDLLLQLNEPPESLCDEFISHARQKIDKDLQDLKVQLKLVAGEHPHQVSEVHERPSQAYVNNTPVDILEFIDTGCNTFLSNICLIIASYNDMFLNRKQNDESIDDIALKKLVNFVNELMAEYFELVRRRVQLEKETGDNTILVRALDRFHRRLQAMNKLLPDTDFSRAGTEIVLSAAKDRVRHYLQTLKNHFADSLSDIRHSLAAPKLLGKQDNNLSDLLHIAHTSIVEEVKSVLKNLKSFLSPDITFSLKTYFRGPYCNEGVHEDLMVSFFYHINDVCQEFCDGVGDKGSCPPALILILSRFCMDYSTSTVGYLLNLTEESFLLDDRKAVTAAKTVADRFKESGQRLINHYVKVQGITISQMLRKSVETRDWISTIEPRNVRAVMKRVVEDVTLMDGHVGQLYEEGYRKERSSDSSKRTFNTRQQRSQWNYAPSIDNSLLSNIQKLFSEKIEIFSPVEFSRVSILTGTIKIGLKTFLECVRLRTFGRYGVQQIQVDTHYLQLYLWRFVSDENLVHFLLDEIVGSVVHRCLDPTLMESSVVELICDRG